MCVGLDPDLNRLPAGYEKSVPGLKQHLFDIIDATADLAAAYKPNTAFFEFHGAAGWTALGEVIRYCKTKSPGAVVIADAKRGDLGNTAKQYAAAIFDHLEADACTLSPYMGFESLQPFLERPDKAAVILCLTSNAGAADLQYHGSPPLFLKVAGLCHRWNGQYGNVWMVAGATRDPADLIRVKESAEGVPLLIPGIGAQGGNLSSVLGAVHENCLINSSRSILYASDHRDTIRQSARAEALSLVESMRRELKSFFL